MPERYTSLIVGGGAREHALSVAHERSASVEKIVVAPGNDFLTVDRQKEVLAVALDKV